MTENLNNMYDAYSKILAEKDAKIADLEAKLAEKDKENETMKKDSDKNIDYLVEFASLIENEKDCNRMLKALDRVKSGNKYIIDKTDQSKTEFAIKTLERVKEEMHRGLEFDYDLDIWATEFIEEIIKELEGK